MLCTDILCFLKFEKELVNLEIVFLATWPTSFPIPQGFTNKTVSTTFPLGNLFVKLPTMLQI